MSNWFQRAYRRLRYGKPVIVVSGLPRSGTSMAMSMLEAGGFEVVTDGERTADEDNPRGYHELERVKDLASEGDKSYLRAARGKAVKVISFLLRELPDDNNYDVIFMRRALEEVCASQNKMLERRGEDNVTEDERMFELWEDHLWKVNYMLKHRPQFRFIELPYAEVVANPKRQATRLAEFLGGGLDPETMARVVDEKLYRNRKKSA